MVFGLEGHKGCKVAANIIHGFDCRLGKNPFHIYIDLFTSKLLPYYNT